MPPPPPAYKGATDEETGQANGTNANQNKSQNQGSQEPQNDEYLSGKLNSESKIWRGLTFIIGCLFFLTMYLWYQAMYMVWYNDLLLEVFDATGDTEDSLDNIVAFGNLFCIALVTVGITLALHLYYFVHLNGDREGGTLSVVGDCCDCKGSLKYYSWTITFGYAFGIIMFYAGVFSYMTYLFEEDWSLYYQASTDDNDEYYWGLKTNCWMVFWLYPMILLVLCLQHYKPEMFLKLFEMRVFCYSLLVFSQALIYFFFFLDDENYQKYNYGGTDDDYEAAYDGKFTGATIGAIVFVLVSGALTGLTGFEVNKTVRMQQAGSKADATYFKKLAVLTVLLFLMLVELTIFLAQCDIGWSLEFLQFTSSFRSTMTTTQPLGIGCLWILVLALCNEILL